MMLKTRRRAPIEPYVRPKSSCAGKKRNANLRRCADHGALAELSVGKDMRTNANVARGGVSKTE